MKIHQIEDKDILKYQELAVKNGTIFNCLEWLNIFGEKLKIFGIYDNNNIMIGGFYLYVDSKAGMKYYRNPPFTPFIGLFFENKAQNKVKSHSYEKSIISQIADFISKLPYQILSIAFQKDFIDMQPFIWEKYKVVPNYTYIIDLSQSIDKINSELASERRNDLKKAYKDEVIVEKTEDFNIVKSLVLNTFNRIKNNSFAFTSYLNKTPIATCFCIYDKSTAYYLLGGYDSENRHKGAGALAIWQSIQYAKSLNLDYFDFEGSMVKPIERYFRGFGGDMYPYYTINKAIMPIEIILKFIKRQAF
jgi:lipid II:glycine glycyltransferase (peptidoglycan interpeptide bridge formation enzyme)